MPGYGTWSGTLFNHYSLLATAEQLLGLSRLGLAAGAWLTNWHMNLTRRPRAQ